MSHHGGVVIATVSDLDDPRGEGRIGLKYPWLPENTTSGWAPMATPLAGGSRGMFFMPELNDEVLVAFHLGDFDHPFILGFLWNGVDAPPESNPQHRVIKTPGGLQLRFEDDNLKIQLTTPGGLSVELNDKQSSITLQGGDQSSITLQGGGRSITMQNGSVQIL